MVIGQPQILAEALRKIGFQKLQSEAMPGYRVLGWINWDPHPPIYFRVDRLEQMESPVRVSHPLIQSAKDTINGFRAALV
jgi:heat shock protein HtpX